MWLPIKQSEQPLCCYELCLFNPHALYWCIREIFVLSNNLCVTTNCMMKKLCFICPEPTFWCTKFAANKLWSAKWNYLPFCWFWHIWLIKLNAILVSHACACKSSDWQIYLHSQLWNIFLWIKPLINGSCLFF